MEDTITESEFACQVPVDAIQWSSGPVARLEDRSIPDLLALEHEDLAVYCFDLQTDLRHVRGLWHDTIGALARTADQRDRAIFTVRRARRHG